MTKEKINITCPVESALDIIGGKWKVLILWHLTTGTLRFGEIKRMMPKITQKMLTQQLRELEKDKVIKRKVYAQVPPKVEYSLTKRGDSLRPIMDELCNWGSHHRTVKKK